jgi:hypothetical protein
LIISRDEAASNGRCKNENEHSDEKRNRVTLSSFSFGLKRRFVSAKSGIDVLSLNLIIIDGLYVLNDLDGGSIGTLSI